jgi:hypothetical protein
MPPAAAPSASSQAIPSFLSNSLLSINKLGDDNWVEWSEDMEMFFMGIQADWVTSGELELGQAKLDKALIAYIYSSMHQRDQIGYRGLENPQVSL